MNIETRENLKAAGILWFFGGLILYGGGYLIGGVAIVGGVVVALLPLFLNGEKTLKERIFINSTKNSLRPIPWYLSPVFYIVVVGICFSGYYIAT